jgi:hypothetical protein
MSLIGATVFVAIATAVLAAGAIVTAIYAIRAFGKQSQEVSAIERQVRDQQELTRQQGELLSLQSQQLTVQRMQLDYQQVAINDQMQANTRQAEVAELQMSELRESLSERKREAELRHRAQAARVFISETHHRPGERPELRQPATNAPIRKPAVRAYVKNSSEQPVYDTGLRWHRGPAGYGEPNPQYLGTLMPGEETWAVREFPDDTNLAVSGAVLTFRDAAGITWMRRPDGGLTEQQ